MSQNRKFSFRVQEISISGKLLLNISRTYTCYDRELFHVFKKITIVPFVNIHY